MSELSTVKPVRPVAAYIGGKRGLARRIGERIEAIPHETYAEVFVGMGGVFFRRDLRPKAEVINDYSEDVATFFRVLQHHYVAFTDMIRWRISSRAEFERLIATDPDTLTDMHRAARFLYLQRLAFGGKVAGRNFGVSTGRPAAFDVTKLVPMIEEVHDRLAGVVIERLPWAEFIRRYDREGTLFYLDPPYYGNEGDYGRDLFSRDQFEAMSEVLAGIKGRFILSLNDRPEVRAIFRSFEIEAASVRYTISGADKSTIAGEVIIAN
ncbi:DNA adenine methylase [Asticcacaulis machinosus]|uniref:site-specific DNA-methyltransferase (adenine-specific) n=1 Tax=Asticcacaulis machinosus TaxID=2984211 RepID=A0ABT5HGJ9_9CAUL|nr:DNA adenine methylase [Asticcacaulis machinosus]MDC7675364.1 DNA adenine methylase [Asticcacaulis machinosus]